MKKKTQVNFFLVLAISFIFNIAVFSAAHAQFNIESVNTIPTNPTNTEDTKLIIKMKYNGTGTFYNSRSFSLNSNILLVNEYFDCTPGTDFLYLKVDTIDLGILPADSFSVTIFMNCITAISQQVNDTTVMDSYTLKFNVAVNNSVADPYIVNFKCVPNPSNGNFYIENESCVNNFEIIISDLAGRVQKSLECSKNSQDTPVNLSDFANGVYFVSLISDKFQISIRKITISK